MRGEGVGVEGEGAKRGLGGVYELKKMGVEKGVEKGGCFEGGFFGGGCLAYSMVQSRF